MKNELVGRIMREFVALRPRCIIIWQMTRRQEDKGHKKRRIKFEDYKNCLKNNKILKSDSHLQKKLRYFLHWKPFRNDKKMLFI